MKFVRNKLLLSKLLIGDGLGRAGKSLLCHVLTGFERVEKIEYYKFLEYISLGHYYKKISDDMASSILKTQMDTQVFDQMNGRNINTRPDDYTGLSNYHSPQIYIERQELDKYPKPEYEGNPNANLIWDKIQKENPVFVTFAHDIIFKSKIIFDTFKEKVSLVYLNRLPIDIVYEWHKKDFGERIGTDPTDTEYLISFNNESIPEFAAGWEEEYLNISPLERLVKIIFICFKRNHDGLKLYETDKRLKIVNFEMLVTKPDKEIEKISTFLSLKKLNVMSKILKSNNCPRILDKYEYQKRENSIKKNISKEYIMLINEMNDIYNEVTKLI